jgi:hypothetical protein
LILLVERSKEEGFGGGGVRRKRDSEKEGFGGEGVRRGRGRL